MIDGLFLHNVCDVDGKPWIYLEWCFPNKLSVDELRKVYSILRQYGIPSIDPDDDSSRYNNNTGSACIDDSIGTIRVKVFGELAAGGQKVPYPYCISTTRHRTSIGPLAFNLLVNHALIDEGILDWTHDAFDEVMSSEIMRHVMQQNDVPVISVDMGDKTYQLGMVTQQQRIAIRPNIENSLRDDVRSASYAIRTVLQDMKQQAAERPYMVTLSDYMTSGLAPVTISDENNLYVAGLAKEYTIKPITYSEYDHDQETTAVFSIDPKMSSRLQTRIILIYRKYDGSIFARHPNGDPWEAPHVQNAKVCLGHVSSPANLEPGGVLSILDSVAQALSNVNLESLFDTTWEKYIENSKSIRCYNIDGNFRNKYGTRLDVVADKAISELNGVVINV